MNRDPATMAVGPAARRALRALLDRRDPLKPMSTRDLATAIGSEPGSIHAILRRLVQAGVVSRHTQGNGYPAAWRIEPAALHHARALAVRMYERTAADEGREAGECTIPTWLGGVPAATVAQVWRDAQTRAAQKGPAC
jgi:hypothetical protein